MDYRRSKRSRGGSRRSRRTRRGGTVNYMLHPAPVSGLSSMSDGRDPNISSNGIAGAGITSGGIMGQTLTAGGRHRRSHHRSHRRSHRRHPSLLRYRR